MNLRGPGLYKAFVPHLHPSSVAKRDLGILSMSVGPVRGVRPLPEVMPLMTVFLSHPWTYAPELNTTKLSMETQTSTSRFFYIPPRTISQFSLTPHHPNLVSFLTNGACETPVTSNTCLAQSHQYAGGFQVSAWPCHLHLDV